MYQKLDMTHNYIPLTPETKLSRLQHSGTQAQGSRDRRYIALEDVQEPFRVGVLTHLGARANDRQGVLWRVPLGHESAHPLSPHWAYAAVPRVDLPDLRDYELYLGNLLTENIDWISPNSPEGLILASKKEKWTRRFALLREKRLQVMRATMPRWS